ncbi:MAG: SIS domain-containing protein [Clostridiales bacterium]|nr:SIS domain-containing protein [Clostridiales bacterium]
MKQRTTDIFNQLYGTYPSLKEMEPKISKAFDILMDTCSKGGTVMVCGNGGSAADSEHIVGELMKGFILHRRVNRSDKKFIKDIDEDILATLQGALPAISLVSQSGIISAVANDNSPEAVFAQQVFGYARPGDTLIALSTSGNSKNVVNAIKVADAMGVNTIAITGCKGGKCLELSTVCLNLPQAETFAVQELTLPVYHALCAAVESELFEA